MAEKTAPKEEKQEYKESAVKKTPPKFIKVEDLSPASVGFNLIVKVGKIKPIMDRLNLDGSRLRISEAFVGDATAAVILSLRNDQINMVKETDVLILRNAKIDMVNNGYMRVAIDRWGLIEKVDEVQMDSDINDKNNLSEVEYELVKEQNNYNNRGYGRGRGRGRGYGGRGRGRNYYNNNRGFGGRGRGRGGYGGRGGGGYGGRGGGYRGGRRNYY